MKAKSKHGTTARYHIGCRCSKCRRANAKYHFVLRRVKHKKLHKGLLDVTHGKESTYINSLCRCPKCTVAACGASRKRYERSKLRAV